MSEAAISVAETNTHGDLIAALEAIVGTGGVQCDDETRAYFSQDVYATGQLTAAVVKPATVDQLAEVVRTATSIGYAVFPRGGGYSYTDAYLPTTENGITLDLTALDKVVEINAEDMYVTVETGCTWQALDDALKPHGVRAEFWGPLSGFQATIGGGMSQGAASLGSAKDGISAEAVLGMDIVAADGRIISTGSDAQDGKSPFFRYYGPDLTGMFCGDAGALGIKARITLRLQNRAPHNQGLSFGFETFEAMHEAMQKIALSNRATECFGFTARAMEDAIASKGFWPDIKLMFAVGRASGGPIGGLVQMLRMALAGRRFARRAKFFAHCVVEAYNTTELRGQIKTIRTAVGALGQDFPNTMPSVMRAEPFMPYPVIGIGGKRMLPLHAILPFSQVPSFHAGLEQLLEDRKEDLDATGMIVPAIFTTLSTNGFLYEPVLYWPDQPELFHLRHTPDELMAPMTSQKENPEGRALSQQMFNDIVNLMHRHSGVHLQIGKAYPYTRDRAPEHMALLRQIKAQIDPDNLLNPGALGLVTNEAKHIP